MFHGVSAYNFLRGLSVKITTHNYGQVDSIAGVIYCAGDSRLCVPQGRFLMHGVAAGFEPNVRLEEDQLRERLDGLRKDSGSIATILASRTGMKPEDVKKMMLSRVILDADAAQKHGLVHGVETAVFDAAIPILNIHSE